MTLAVPAKARRQAKARGQILTAKTLTPGPIRVVLSSGRIAVLATSLIDPETYPAWAFAELYHARWNIEEAFKVLEHRLHLEQFAPANYRNLPPPRRFCQNLYRQAPGRSLGPRSLRIVTRD
ncbi:MAG: transposase [Methylococcales bacterium]